MAEQTGEIQQQSPENAQTIETVPVTLRDYYDVVSGVNGSTFVKYKLSDNYADSGHVTGGNWKMNWGVGIGTGCVVILIIILIIWLCKKKNKGGKVQ